jgi:phospholipid-binding lipoprotein MlaA
MLHRLLHELVVGLPGPMWSGGLGNAFTGLRLAIELRLVPLQACLAWVRSRTLSPLAAAAALTLPALAGCADPASEPRQQAALDAPDDPAESVNRAIFDGNQFADLKLVHPVARAYRDYVPVAVQRGIHNFVGNLREPQIAVNDALQGNLRRAGKTTLRFGVNTTAGVAGLFDVATGRNLPRHQADFGQTLGVWGVGPGPFVELPLLGPSNVRDAVGSAIGVVADPLGAAFGAASGALTMIGYARTGFGAVDGRAETLDASDQLEAQSLDYYATLRSVSSQRREALVAEGKNPARYATSPARSDAGPPSPAVP